jgi:hypothetical protein
MIEGETNRMVFNLAPAVGANTFSSTPTVECGDLTFSGTSASGSTVTTFVSGGEAGRDYTVKLTAILSSGETKVAAINLEWKAPGEESRAGS